MASKGPPAVGREQRGYARVVDDADAEDDEKAAQRRRWKRLAIKCLKYAYSTVGMGLLTIAYVAAGAFAFQALELPDEIVRCHASEESYMEAENASAATILAYVRKYNGTAFQSDTEQADVEAEILDVLRNFSSTAIGIGYRYSNECSTINEPDGRQPYWSLMGSLFFAITVVTTVGYGNFTPMTTPGRISCMFYALIGIPIMLAFLANLTGMMANVFRFVYASFCCCGCLAKDDPEDDHPEPLPLAGSSSKTVWVTDATGRPIERVPNETAAAASRAVARASSPSSESDAGSDGGEYEDDYEEDDAVAVPLTISIVTLLTYVAIGGSVSSVLEEKWTYVNSFYFAFVTTATIGFGDLTPNYQGDIMKIVLNSVFMVLGIAWLGMCFQLMQDEMVTKFRWLVSKIKRKTDSKEDGDASAQDGSVKA